MAQKTKPAGAIGRRDACRPTRRRAAKNGPRCDGCGKAAKKVVGCPDGREICRECFDQGVG